jgi:hypothetical protein
LTHHNRCSTVWASIETFQFTEATPVRSLTIDFARSAVVPLTSIRQPTRAIGTTAIDLLIEAAEDPANHEAEHVVFQPELVTRVSTGLSR